MEMDLKIPMVTKTLKNLKWILHHVLVKGFSELRELVDSFIDVYQMVRTDLLSTTFSVLRERYGTQKLNHVTMLGQPIEMIASLLVDLMVLKKQTKATVVVAGTSL